MLRGFANILSVILVIFVICSCKNSPELQKANESASAGISAEEIHKNYQNAILNGEQKDLAYDKYCEWLVKHFDSLIAEVQKTTGVPDEVVTILNLRNGYMQVLDTIGKEEKFIVDNYIDSNKYRNFSMMTFRKKTSEQRQLLNYHIDSLERKAIELKQKASNEAKKGEAAYRLGRIDLADLHFKAALSADSRNKRAKQLTQNINNYEYGRSLYMRRSISKSKQVFEDLIHNNPNDIVITKLSQRELNVVRQKSIMADNLKLNGVKEVSRKRFKSAEIYFRRAMKIDKDLEIELISAIKATDQFELALKAYAKKDYQGAVKLYQEGLKLWPNCKTAETWLNKVQIKLKNREVALKMKAAEKLLLKEKVADGKKLVQQAIEISPNKRKTEKLAKKLYAKVVKEYMRLYKKGVKKKDLQNQWHYISSCLSIGANKRCEKYRDDFVKDNLDSIIVDARALYAKKNWPKALVASGAVLELDKENQEISVIYNQAKQNVIADSTVLVYRMNQDKTTNGNSSLSQSFMSLAKTFDDNNLNWKWGTASSENESGKKYRLYVTETPKPDKNGEVITELPDAQVIDNKKKNDVQAPVVKMGWLHQIKDDSDNIIAWAWSETPDCSESASQLAMAFIDYLKTVCDDKTDLESAMLLKYMRKPPLEPESWLKIYLALPK